MSKSKKPQDKLTTLSPTDAEIWDEAVQSRAGEQSLTLAGVSESHLKNRTDTPHHEERHQKILQVMSLLDHCGVDAAPDDLVQRTLARIHDAKQRQRFAHQVNALATGTSGGRFFWWREMLTVAGVMLITASLLLPALDRMRADARQVACANNLAVAGRAFGGYAADHNNTLPRGQAKPGTVWWNVGHTNGKSEKPSQSNSAHLYILVRNKYVAPDTLACPDNPWAGHQHHDASMHDWSTARAVSYSYQNQYTPQAMRVDRLPEMAILADKNPLFVGKPEGGVGLSYRKDIDPTSSTVFHNQSGQNILTTTGSVMWNNRPIGPNGDNIWLIRGVDDYRGVETPQDADDSFLVP